MLAEIRPIGLNGQRKQIGKGWSRYLLPKRLPGVPQSPSSELHRTIVAERTVAVVHRRIEKRGAIPVCSPSSPVQLHKRGVSPELGEAQEAAEDIALGRWRTHSNPFASGVGRTSRVP